MVKDFFYSIAWLFEEILFFPFDLLRTIQYDSWFFANIMSWTFILIGIIGTIYWIKQLKIPIFIGGGINQNNVSKIINAVKPDGLDISRSLKNSKNILSSKKLNTFLSQISVA